MTARGGAVAAAQRSHDLAHRNACVATMTERGEAGTAVVRLFGDGTTGVLLRDVQVGKHRVLGYVELDDRDTITRVTAVNSATGAPLSLFLRRLAGHVALRATIRMRRRLRLVSAAHARPRFPFNP